MATEVLLSRAFQLLEFNRVAWRHPNHRIITPRDLQIARDIVTRNGEAFPTTQFISVLEFVDGPISEQTLGTLLLQLRASAVSTDFRYQQPTGEDEAEATPEPAPQLEPQPAPLPTPEPTPEPEPEPEPDVQEEGDETNVELEQPEPEREPAQSPNRIRWLHRLIFVATTTLFIYALGAKVKHLRWHGLEHSLVRPTQSYLLPVLFSSGAPSPTPPPTHPLSFPSPKSPKSVAVPAASTSTSSNIHCAELRRLAMSDAEVEKVVEAAKRCTLASVPDLRAFHKRFRLFITQVPPAEVAACVRRQPFVTDMPDFGGIFRGNSNVEQKEAFRECVAELKEAVEAGVPMASGSADATKSYIDWERVVSCLAWTTCDKQGEWDQTLPVKEIWDEDDYQEIGILGDDEEVLPSADHVKNEDGGDEDIFTPYEVEMDNEK
ncbi:hypothetical protein PG990_013143 [Apiospora arundinis]